MAILRAITFMIPIVIIEITSIMPSSGHGEMSILQFEHAYQFIWDNDSNELVAIFFSAQEVLSNALQEHIRRRLQSHLLSIARSVERACTQHDRDRRPKLDKALKD